MKSTIFLISMSVTLLSSAAPSFAAGPMDTAAKPKVAFACRNASPVDGTEISITIVLQGTDYMATLVGASSPGPYKADRVLLSPADALRMPGVSHILRTLGLSSGQWATVTQAVVFTVGNFDDDMAGVRSVSFLDAQNTVVGSGMFFGWGGPFACL
jgi:hypothetical protein